MIITNTYMSQCKNRQLPGVAKDLNELKETFREPSFESVIAENDTKEELEKKIKSISELASQYKYRSVFVAFSGHGGKENNEQFIMSDDWKKKWLKELVDPVVACFNEEVPKIFLLDLCRGSKGLQLRAKGEGNYLIAYATEDEHKALMRKDDGGSYWMPVVARNLRMVDNTVLNIITETKVEVQESPDLNYVQCPVLDDDNFNS